MTAPYPAAHPPWPVPAPERPRLPRRVGAALVALVRRVVVDPVVEGRIRLRGAPPGLGVLAVTAAGCFAAALVLIVAAPALRDRLPISVSPVGVAAPDALIWPIVAFLVLAAALVQVAGLHAPWWGRAGALAVSATFLSAVGIQATGPVAIRHALVAGGAWLGLVLLSVLRRRRLFAWWEAALVLVLIAGPTALTAAASLPGRYALDSGAYVTYAWYLLLNLGLLATPVVVAAGFALAQVGYATIVWGVDLTRRTVPRAGLLVVLVGVAAWRLWAEITHWRETWLLSGGRIVASVVLLAVTVGLWWLLDRIADRRRAATTRPRHLGEDLQRILIPAAVIMTAATVARGLVQAPLQFVGTVLGAAGAPELGRAVIDAEAAVVDLLAAGDGRVGVLVTAGALLAWAIWLAVRADRGAAELVAAVALLYGCRPVFGYEPTTWYLPLVATIALSLATVVWAVRRRLTPARVEAIVVLYLLLAAFGSRELFADPLTLVLGPAAAVVFGLGWGFLTGAPSTGGAARLPAATAWFLGTGLLGAAVVAFVALGSNPAESIDPTQLTLLGDQTLGSGLLLIAAVVVGACAVRAEEVGRPD